MSRGGVKEEEVSKADLWCVSPVPAQSRSDFMSVETAQNVPRQGILRRQEGRLSKQLTPASA